MLRILRARSTRTPSQPGGSVLAHEPGIRASLLVPKRKTANDTEQTASPQRSTHTRWKRADGRVPPPIVPGGTAPRSLRSELPAEQGRWNHCARRRLHGCCGKEGRGTMSLSLNFPQIACSRAASNLKEGKNTGLSTDYLNQLFSGLVLRRSSTDLGCNPRATCISALRGKRRAHWNKHMNCVPLCSITGHMV